jgi:hypothetical protein
VLIHFGAGPICFARYAAMPALNGHFGHPNQHASIWKTLI